ncbi:hypothetical protein HYFRA_00004793 [Hymenoscyphus fraxineus]|uniref:Uncharacterized protein n=1 Tax=Hymenoscyphus fraxineus TaxID=746836 RepID=A0A9N9KLJ6_9HELO|nr:hypothetical protein HYFRA_00004793 [Hymenoscyphus fraxineus]
MHMTGSRGHTRDAASKSDEEEDVRYAVFYVFNSAVVGSLIPKGTSRCRFAEGAAMEIDNKKLQNRGTIPLQKVA